LLNEVKDDNRSDLHYGKTLEYPTVPVFFIALLT